VRRTKYFLFGYFGQQNTGDDAMLYCWLSNMSAKHTAYVLAKNDSYYRPTDKEAVTVPYSVWKVALMIAYCNVFVVVGGTHLSDYGRWQKNLQIVIRIFLLSFYAKLCGKRVVFDSIGIVCSSKWYRIALWCVCKLADSISVRDRESSRILQGLNIRHYANSDLSITLPDYSGAVIQDKQCLGVNVFPSWAIYFGDKAKDKRHLLETAKLVNEYYKQGGFNKVKLLVFSEIDTLYVKEFHKLLLAPAILVPYNPNPIKKPKHQKASCYVIISRADYAPVFNPWINDVGVDS